MHWLIFWLCFWLALILFLTVYYKDVKTYLGDLELKKELDKLPKDKYMVINKVMIKDDNGKKTEIDSIILSKYGIFVIKLMKKNGTIEVYEQQNAWKVIKNGKESFISNLIVENNNNIKLISKLLNIDPKYFISIICFPNKTKIITNNNYITQIDYLNYLISQITNPILNINLILLKYYIPI